MKLRAFVILSFLTALCIVIAPPAFSEDLISGKVLETMDSGGYTYVLLEDHGSKLWVAVPQMEVTVGSRMGFRSGMEMTDFTSKSLKRTFDRIIFSQGPAVDKKSKEITPWEKLEVKKPKGTNVYTVAELYKKINELKGKTVVVRGQVVSFSPNIMQKNWIHLQDGSGNQKKADHDIVVTTMDSAAVGDIVTVSGALVKDKDYGFGYKYPVVIEDATVSK